MFGIAGKLWLLAQILISSPTVVTLRAGGVQPSHADPVAFLEALYAGSAAYDAADDFMAGDEGTALGRQVAFGNMQVGPTHPAHLNSNEDFALGRLGSWQVQRVERVGLDRSGSNNSHGVHRVPLMRSAENTEGRRRLSSAGAC